MTYDIKETLKVLCRYSTKRGILEYFVSTNKVDSSSLSYVLGKGNIVSPAYTTSAEAKEFMYVYTDLRDKEESFNLESDHYDVVIKHEKPKVTKRK